MKGYVLVAAAAIGWGLWPLVLRHAPMPPALQSAIMMTVLTIASAPLVLVDRLHVRARPIHWLGIAWLGIADAANVALFFAAYQRTTVAIAVLTHYLTPAFVALAAPFALGEHLPARTKVAVAVSFVGLVLLLQPWHASFGANDAIGALLGAGSAVFYASNVLVNKRLSLVFSGSEMMFFHGFVGIPLLWAFVPRAALGGTPLAAIGIVALASIGIGALGGLMFTWGLRRIAASHASILTLLEPLVAVLTAVLFLGQTLGSIPIVGGGLILASAVAVVTAKRGDGVQSAAS